MINTNNMFKCKLRNKYTDDGTCIYERFSCCYFCSISNCEYKCPQDYETCMQNKLLTDMFDSNIKVDF